MSSIFSSDRTEGTGYADLSQLDSLLETNAPSTAYGLATNKTSTGGAIAAPISDRWQVDSFSTDRGALLASSDRLLTDFVERDRPPSSEHSSLAFYADDITGLPAHSPQVNNHLQTSSRISESLSFDDDLNPTRTLAYKDDYVLYSPTTDRVRLTMDSSEFDTYLQIVDINTGEVLAFDDDGGSSTNSELTFTVQAGQRYTVRATSYAALETGAYNLAAYFGSGNQPEPPTDRQFNQDYGYGTVDAAAAVAAAAGRSRFSDVADRGGNEWNNDLIYAPEVWNQGYTGEGVTVAVIDSGVDISHSDLRDNIWENAGEILGDGIDNDGNGYIDDRYGWNFGVGQNNNDVRPGTSDPGQSHGTHVAGTIAAANNGFGMTGVAHNAEIMAIRMGNVSGNSFTNAGRLSEAIRYAVDNGADVINMSLGWNPEGGAVREALAYAASRNVIAVMSSGNSSASRPGSPANNATDYGISVGAVDRNGAIARFSNRAGSDDRMQHVMAPGVNIYSTVADNRWNYSSGTSMASPHVAGVVALMLSANRNLTHAQVRDILTSTSVLNSAAAAPASAVASVSASMPTAQISLAERSFEIDSAFSSSRAFRKDLSISSMTQETSLPTPLSELNELSVTDESDVDNQTPTSSLRVVANDTPNFDSISTGDWQISFNTTYQVDDLLL